MKLAKNTVIFLMGPTCSGKTQAAIELASQKPVDIISVDSSLVYKGMDIGSGKPTREEQALAPHGLIDIRDVTQPYSAADFCADAIPLIQKSLAAGRIPLLVGGTMLYFRALQFGLSDLPASDPIIRQQLELQCKEQGIQALHQRLKQIDPVLSDKFHPNDTQRILRALEINLLTGQSPSALFKQEQTKAPDFNFVASYIPTPDRAQLHQQIAIRFHKMLELGFVEEVEQFYRREDVHADLPAMKAVGYRQIWRYLAGEINKNEMIEQALAATRQLAKRQITWLRSWPNLITFTQGVGTQEKHDMKSA